jgi:Fe-S-cluster containining protein
MIVKYKQYLDTLDKKLAKFFESQKPYICCKEGCSSCCEIGEYPYTRVEVQYLMLGFHRLVPDVKLRIVESINELKRVKGGKDSSSKFMHACPFLIDKKCSVYEFRGIICRTHGLAFYDGSGKIRVPSCVNEGLNYSEVYDKATNILSSELWEASGYEQEPVSFNLSRKFLLNNEATQYLGLDFGEEKALAEWL